jgi:hypothetical protein
VKKRIAIRRLLFVISSHGLLPWDGALDGLLPVRRRCVSQSARDRKAGRSLPGSDVPGQEPRDEKEKGSRYGFVRRRHENQAGGSW